MDEFIRLSEGRRLPDKIVELTGITEQMLLDDGIENGWQLKGLRQCSAGRH